MKHIATLAALAALSLSTTAMAQDEVEPATEAPAAETPVEEEPKGRPGMDDPMGSFGLSARLGMSIQAKRTAVFDGDDQGSFDGQNGLHFIFGLNFGDGHGFGTDLNIDVRRYKLDTGFGDVKFGDVTLEPIFGARFQLMDPLYMFVGAGPRIGYGWSDSPISQGAGVVGLRVPVQVNYYFIPQMAAQFELGIGWDVRVGGEDDFATGDTLLAVDRGVVVDFAFGLRFF